MSRGIKLGANPLHQIKDEKDKLQEHLVDEIGIVYLTTEAYRIIKGEMFDLNQKVFDSGDKLWGMAIWKHPGNVDSIPMFSFGINEQRSKLE